MECDDTRSDDASPAWVFREVDEKEVEDFAKRTGYSRIVSRLFLLRGIRSEKELDRYLNDDFFSLHNPFLFKQMGETVARVKQALNNGEKIFIFGDRDVDGVLSTAMLYNALMRFDADVFYKVPEGEYGYGIEKRDVDLALERGTGLLITVDTGISSVEEIEYAAQKGIETIVIDHHEQTCPLPVCTAVLNPKAEDETYPFRDLSAGGVVLKFIHAFILSHTKNYNRVFIPLVADGDRIHGMKVKNGLIEERLELTERIHYPIDQSHTVVRDSSSQLPKYFSSWLKERHAKQVRLVCNEPYETIDEFTEIFIRLFARKQNKSVSFVRSYIDLAAISTVSDIMPLVKENRIIVREGLKNIRKTDNLGLSVLLGYCDVPDNEITAKSVAWNLAPIINSAGRMGEAQIAVKLFTTDDRSEANELSRILVDLNEKRKDKGKKNLSIIRPMVVELEETKPVIVLSADTVDHGVTGIIASRISKEFCKPTIIIVNDGNIGVGSGRGGGGFDLVSLVSSCEDLLVKYGGHRSAVGFTIEIEKIEPFIHRIEEVAGKNLERFKGKTTLEIDALLPTGDMTFSLIDELAVFEPSGIGNELPKFSLLGTTVINPTAIGKQHDHLKFLIPTDSGTIPVLGWGFAQRGIRILEKSDLVDIVFSIEENIFRGERTIQLILHDMRASSNAA
ncbi:MAG: single-stranded-DNA-specific exonuclease RecJ [Spirochaetes bacterium]|nr:single-stranded-DNA-specific exonuclease RecJ [Spirochaetota bacterium]